MLIGATLEKAEINEWERKLPHNMWMRVFPNNDGLVPVKSDLRYEYLRRVQPGNQRVVFVSSKVRARYTAGSFGIGILTCLTRIKELVDDGFLVFYTEHHEAEADMTPEAYKADQNLVFDMVDALSPNYRARIRVGHVPTRQWTENGAAGKGNFNYRTYDTGRGDFFGPDMYGNSWAVGDTSAVTTAFVSPSSFLQYVKAYKFDENDTRDRLFPELGYIGAPFDTTGSARAAWIQGVHDEVSTWTPEVTGWKFIGWIWWNTEGKSGSVLAGAGAKRWFQLDRRHTGQPVVIDSVSWPQAGWQILNPPLALNKFKEIALAAQAAPPVTGPTEDQLQAAYDEGYAAGDLAGFARGTADKAAAVAAATEAGRTEGFAAGRAQGRREGEAAIKLALSNDYNDRMNAATPIY